AIAPKAIYLAPDPARLAKVTAADFERIFKPAMTQAPMEVTVVGDLDESTAVDAVGRTLGALPARSSAPRARPDTFFLRYPAEAVAEAARKTALDLVRDGIGQDAFEAARKPVIDQAATHLQDADWWMGGLDGSAGNAEILREFVDWDADMGSVTLADVNREAK